MVGRWIVLALLAGCGRVSFDGAVDGHVGSDATDARACVSTGHDEDGDGVDDACDVCPHLAGPQDDRDGDGVGDACDPQPDVPAERIALFDPMTSDRATFFDFYRAVSFTGETLRLDAMAGDEFFSMKYLHTGGTHRMEVKEHMLASTGIPRVELVFYDGTDTSTHHYCELQETYFQLTHFDGSGYTTIGSPGPDPGMPLATTEYRFRFDHGPATMECTVDFDVVHLDVEGTIPAADPTPYFAIVARRSLVDIEYFIDIVTE